ncbi:MAG: hypothetical protein KYX69_19840 [Sphingomonas sp.]|uniref:hypothetical protein n=1 Tax=Sphingomonas sp. TaxID=28214 RepID=UPI00260933FA|nr:hypothetical protein [Sphingomonas sp.]MDK2769957.1 hypothetical protein [Sphingomonas sp.]
MTQSARMAREDALTEALRVADTAIGSERPEPQAFRIIAAIRELRDAAPARVTSLSRIDYLERVQRDARIAWGGRWQGNRTGPEHDATAGVDTPLGRLRVVVWRRPWKGERRGQRIAWAGEYYLNDEPITVAEIKAAGLAQRPTTRRRQRKDGKP